MKCSKCGKYSYSLGRCVLGKINPRTIKGGVSAAQFMGISYICDMCPIKGKIISKLTTTTKE